ncbi:MAG: DUF134 domain-containing protein [Holophagales bacterium]|nr:DUF134 domain-containing protein [Holophagales bacterium]
MPRPRCCRRIAGEPPAGIFKPAGIPGRLLEEVVLGLDGLEALRLADLEGLYHEEAAARMGVSRATFGRIVADARHRVAEALVQGKLLRIEGGTVSTATAEDRTSTRGTSVRGSASSTRPE